MKEALISFSLLTKLLHSFHLFPEAFSGERKRSASSCPGASSPTVPWGAYWRRAVDFTDPAGPGGRHQLLLDHSMSAPTAGPGHELLAQRPSRGGAVPRPTPDPDLRLGPDSGLGVRGRVRAISVRPRVLMWGWELLYLSPSSLRRPSTRRDQVPDSPKGGRSAGALDTTGPQSRLHTGTTAR